MSNRLLLRAPRDNFARARHRSLRLLHRDAGLQSAYATHETVAAHDALFRRVWIIERRRDKNLESRPNHEIGRFGKTPTIV
jgi:hypothetical protein